MHSSLLLLLLPLAGAQWNCDQKPSELLTLTRDFSDVAGKAFLQEFKDLSLTQTGGAISNKCGPDGVDRVTVSCAEGSPGGMGMLLADVSDADPLNSDTAATTVEIKCSGGQPSIQLGGVDTNIRGLSCLFFDF